MGSVRCEQPDHLAGPTQTDRFLTGGLHLGISEAAFRALFPYRILTRSHGVIDILKEQVVGEERQYWVGTKWGVDHSFIFSGERLIRYEKCDSLKFWGCVWFDHTSQLRLIPTHRVSYYGEQKMFYTSAGCFRRQTHPRM